MRVVAFLMLAAASTAAVLFACSDDKPAQTTPSDAGSSNNNNNGPDPHANEFDAAQILLSPTGCRLKSTNFLVAKKIENLPISDQPTAVAWTNVEGARESNDNQVAEVVLDDNQQSMELRLSNFGAQIPKSAATWGMEFQLRRRAEGGVEDKTVNMVMTNVKCAPDVTICPQFKYFEVPWPKSAFGIHHYGQPTDTWKVDLYPADVTPETFAAKLVVKKQGDAGPGPVTAWVDSIKVAIYYCPYPDEDFSDKKN